MPRTAQYFSPPECFTILVFDAARKSAVKLMLKTWIKDAKIKDVGAYFAVADAKKELSGWAPGLRVSTKGYMLGYQSLDDPSVKGFYRFLAKVGDNMMTVRKLRFTIRKSSRRLSGSGCKSNMWISFQTGAPTSASAKIFTTARAATTTA